MRKKVFKNMLSSSHSRKELNLEAPGKRDPALDQFISKSHIFPLTPLLF